MNSTSETTGVQRRPSRRTGQACHRCKDFKIRCDDKQPACSNCIAKNLECIRDEKGQKSTKGPTRGPSLEQRLIQIETLLQVSTSLDNDKNSRHQLKGTTQLHRPPWDGSTCKGPASANLEYAKEASNINRSHVGSVASINHATREKVNGLKGTISDGANSNTPFIQMLPKAQLIPLAECFLNEINTVVPLFDRSRLERLCHESIPKTSKECDEACWANLNTIIAMTLQLKAPNSDFMSIAKISWSYFKNAFSVYRSLTEKEPTLCSLQAILTIAMFLSGTTDTQTTTILLSSAIKMLQTLGLHRSNQEMMVGPESEEITRLFWVTFLLDTTTSLHSRSPSSLFDDGLDIRLNRDYPNPTGSTLNFKLRLELAIIESQIHRCLCLQPALRNPADSLHHPLRLQARLETWMQNTPLQIRPGCNASDAIKPKDLAVTMLHCTFYRCANMVARALQNSLSASSQLNPPDMRGFFPSTHSLEPARATIRLAHTMIPLSYPGLWQFSQYLLSSTIALLPHVLECPLSANDDIILINSSTAFIRQRQQDGCELNRLLAFCGLMVQIVEIAQVQAMATACKQPTSLKADGVSPTDGALSEFLTDKLRTLAFALKKSDPMQIAQGLMGNIPAIKNEAFGVFSVVLGDWAMDPDGTVSIAPAALSPKTYGFRM